MLSEAAELARAQSVAPEAALLAGGFITESFFYRSLAAHLGVAFIEKDASLGDGVRYPHSISAGIAPLSGPGPRWLVAPRGATLSSLLRRKDQGEEMAGSLAITTPANMSRLVRALAAPLIARHASLALATRYPQLSARAGATEPQCCAVIAAIATFGLACAFAPPMTAALAIGAGLLFLAAISLRLFAGAASAEPARAGLVSRVYDRQLPPYSIIVALHKEARIVRELVAALDAIDYPRGKLDIKLVIEEDDDATRLALEALDLPPIYEIVVAPRGWPRTKPRALNIALSLVAGEYVAIFDAEDVPAPQQLRDAAERFLRAPPQTACLQAQLAIDNIEDSWLTRLFAIEYAALFDVVTHGLADLRLPIPLGGTSNHFRTDVLRKICGWDPWNVTEDADLGLRLDRFGYRSETLVSTTREEAPAEIKAWITQRRRWSKGWMQTFVTLSRNPAALRKEVGWSGVMVYALMMINLVIGPLFGPFLTGVVIVDLARFGLPHPDNIISAVAATLWLSVAAFGAGSIVWIALLGMKRRKLLRLWLFLPLLLPYYILISAASWAALYDLIMRPFHWHKTEHGLAKSSWKKSQALAAAAARLGARKSADLPFAPLARRRPAIF
ncbi:glycosyl transferase family 2 [Methylocella silvestris BL2]|uniref:Glycosyl transferase family 2 n=1 Tax=Methylocella silvestris (strain DSM 15510 / CIP 108128 / LMG 27833 / NCIMB 13906 / BL2) TaxID=395965 RepID=B8ETG3_METSB|nr:glycosyl transferase family 2 [Methylocella silvestris BL2]